MQPSHQLQPPNDDEVFHFDASLNQPSFNNDSESGLYNANYLPFNLNSYGAGLQMTGMHHLPQLPSHYPQNLDAPAIGAVYHQPEPSPSQFQAPMFANTSMLPQLHLQSLDTPAFGAMRNDAINPGIAQSSCLATGPLNYYPAPNMGSFYPDFSAPVMSKGNDIALPPGMEDKPRREMMFMDKDTTVGQHAEQYQQGGKAQSVINFREYRYPPRKRGKKAMGRVEKSISSRSRASSPAPSTALPIAASAPSTSTYRRLDLAYDKNNSKHQHIVDSAKDALIRNAVNENCLTDTSTRQQLVLQKLRAAAMSEYQNDEVFAKNWAGVNSVTLYMDLSAPYKSIMQTQKRIARTLVQRGYHLRPPAWAATIEPEYQASQINELIDDMIVFPPRYVFGEDEVTHELHFLENEVVWDVLLNSIVELGLYPYLVDLDKMFCAAAAAVKCALMELRMGKFREIDFTFQGFEQIYKELMKHIDEYISLNPELLKRWNKYKRCTLARLSQIA